MSSMPPDQPTEPSATPPPPPAPPPPEPPMGGTTVVGGTVSGGPPRTQINVTDIARLPMPGNAEFALWLFLEVVFTLCWWISDDVDVYAVDGDHDCADVRLLHLPRHREGEPRPRAVAPA